MSARARTTGAGRTATPLPAWTPSAATSACAQRVRPRRATCFNNSTSYRCTAALPALRPHAEQRDAGRLQLTQNTPLLSGWVGCRIKPNFHLGCNPVQAGAAMAWTARTWTSVRSAPQTMTRSAYGCMVDPNPNLGCNPVQAGAATAWTARMWTSARRAPPTATRSASTRPAATPASAGRASSWCAPCDLSLAFVRTWPDVVAGSASLCLCTGALCFCSISCFVC